MKLKARYYTYAEMYSTVSTIVNTRYKSSPTLTNSFPRRFFYSHRRLFQLGQIFSILSPRSVIAELQAALEAAHQPLLTFSTSDASSEPNSLCPQPGRGKKLTTPSLIRNFCQRPDRSNRIGDLRVKSPRDLVSGRGDRSQRVLADQNGPAR